VTISLYSRQALTILLYALILAEKDGMDVVNASAESILLQELAGTIGLGSITFFDVFACVVGFALIRHFFDGVLFPILVVCMLLFVLLRIFVRVYKPSILLQKLLLSYQQ
jgi:hypothetical protein